MNEHNLLQSVINDLHFFMDLRKRGLPMHYMQKIWDFHENSIQVARLINLGFLPHIRGHVGERLFSFGPAEVMMSIIGDTLTPQNVGPEAAIQGYMKTFELATREGVPPTVLAEGVLFADALEKLFAGSRFITNPDEAATVELLTRKKFLTKDVLEALFKTGPASDAAVFYQRSLIRTADNFVAVNDFAGAIAFLIRETEEEYEPESAKIARVDFERLMQLNYYNNLLGILPLTETVAIRTGKLRDLSSAELKKISEMESPYLTDTELSELYFYETKPLPLSERERIKRTVISLVVPFELPQDVVHLPNGLSFESTLTVAPFADPIFQVCHLNGYCTRGIPLAVFSPAVHADKATILRFTLDGFFHPDFRIEAEDQVRWRDGTERTQLYGGVADGMQPRIAEALIRVQEEGGWSDFDTVARIIDEFTGYAVLYDDAEGGDIFHYFRPLKSATVLNSLQHRFSRRFLTAIESGISIDEAKELTTRGDIHNDAALSKYTFDVLDRLIASRLADGDLWKLIYIYGTRFENPLPEPELQRVIFNIIEGWFEIHGLTLTRESEAAGGKIDFLVTGSHNRKKLSCVVELKYAHHDRLLDGAAIQLPAYMKATRSKRGIFFAVWCKGSRFELPTDLNDIDHLRDEIVAVIPAELSVDILIADASYKPPPSKRRH